MINKAEVYRKAAEIIVRDGKTEGELTERGEGEHLLKEPGLPVCALGACARAQYELYGTLPQHPDGYAVAESTYALYDFQVEMPHPTTGLPTVGTIYRFNDRHSTSAEDVALKLKQHAEEIDR